MLMGVGFGQAKLLAKKVFSCYSLCMMQLSKQFHYDFKLRALVSIIRNAGGKRVRNPEMPEEEIMVLNHLKIQSYRPSPEYKFCCGGSLVDVQVQNS